MNWSEFRKRATTSTISRTPCPAMLVIYGKDLRLTALNVTFTARVTILFGFSVHIHANGRRFP